MGGFSVVVCNFINRLKCGVDSFKILMIILRKRYGRSKGTNRALLAIVRVTNFFPDFFTNACYKARA